MSDRDISFLCLILSVLHPVRLIDLRSFISSRKKILAFKKEGTILAIPFLSVMVSPHRV
jgi:hypothetical protein